MRFGFLALALVGLLISGKPVLAEGGFTDMTRYVFAPLQGSSGIAVIDSRDDSVAGMVEVGMVPSQVELAPGFARLAAIDGRSTALSVVALSGGAPVQVPLGFTPDRLVLGGDGRTLAAIASSVGQAAFVDLSDLRVTGRVSGLGSLNDALFNGDASALYVAAKGQVGLRVVAVPSGRVTGEMASDGEVASLGRAPSGRVAYALAKDGGRLAVADLKDGRMGAGIAIGLGTRKAYTNATGITLVLPDNDRHEVDFVSASSLKRKAALKGGSGMNGVYSGWFDTVTFVPDTDGKSVLVFDQQGLERGTDIPLPGVPGRGTVTPDGKKLYLPLTDSAAVAVINAETRAFQGVVPLSGRPLFAVMGRTFGICH